MPPREVVRCSGCGVWLYGVEVCRFCDHWKERL